MSHFSSRAYVIVALVGGTLALYACGSSDSSAPANTSAGKGGTTTAAGAPAEAGTGGTGGTGDDSSIGGAGGSVGGDDASAGSGGGLGLGQLDCTATPQDAATCGACCGQSNPDGKSTFTVGLANDCGCQAGAECVPSCAHTCAGDGTPEPGCETCITGLTAAATCIKKFNTDCAGDAGCNAFATCAKGCAQMGAGGAPPATTAPICDSGFQVPIAQQACADCLSNSADCCASFTACEQDSKCKSCASTSSPGDSCLINGKYTDVASCIGDTCKAACK